MREYLPYFVLAAIVIVIYVYRRGGLKLPLPAPATPLRPPLATAGRTSTDLFAAAQAAARHEAALELDARFADEARKAAFAIYHAPFSAPPEPPAA